MKFDYVHVIPIILLSLAFNTALSDRKNITDNPNSYFPVNQNITLVYESSFGESVTKYLQDGDYIISLSEADDFIYRQDLILKDDGVYTTETYQYFKVFLFIKKEATFVYGKPLLRFPLPISPGMEWIWEGYEFSHGEKNKVKVSGRAIEEEYLLTKAGSFKAIKLETIVEGSSNSRNTVTEWYAKGIGLIKAEIVIEGGGMMGFLRDILGYGTLQFELTEIRKH
ncbi:MAG: hypothetical protein R6W68_02010 [Ignavibacteriaceae bacterium]